MSLGPGLELGVGVYCMVRETKKPSFVSLYKKTNEEVKTQTKLLCQDTGSVLLPTDIKYYQMLGDEKVKFEKEEMDEIKKFGDTGINLLGFRAISKLKWHHYVKPASFIYPDETVVNGSTTLFSALHQKCIARKVAAICKFLPRANSCPQIVALVPQEEELDECNVQICPPGFNVIFLPYAEDLRKVDLPKPSKASDEQIDKAKKIIRKLMFNFQSESFENPVLQKHYRTLEAIALEHENVEEINDLTLPDVNQIDKRAGKVIDEFKLTVFPPGFNPDARITKRKATTEGGQTKKPKVDPNSVDVESTAKNGGVR
jgi:ATP-dependent DNA helicase 2 subunit 1